MSKMGISTYQSYCGAQIFDALGLSSELVAKYFTGTATPIEGVGIEEVAEEAARRHRRAYHQRGVEALPIGGNYAWRTDGEEHAWTPGHVADLQHAVRGNLPDKYRSFAEELNGQSRGC
jgi:glutamate synthase (NADPH/NADH) large chain